MPLILLVENVLILNKSNYKMFNDFKWEHILPYTAAKVA